MVANILSFPGHVWHKCVDLLHYPLSWLTALGLFIVDIFAGHKFVLNMVVIVTVMDFCWGIAVSVKNSKFTLSELMRQTVAKVAVYGCALWIFFALDTYVAGETGLELSISSGLVSVVIVLTEGWSSAASALILFPNMPFLKLMQKALTGEIAQKLDVPAEKVEEIMSQARAGMGTPKRSKKK